MTRNLLAESWRERASRRSRWIALWAGLFVAGCSALAQDEPVPPALSAPISVYNNWSSYDELSDNIPLTEKLAMRELDELLRLKRAGVRFDYYMMDAFWFAPDGAYRTWRAPNWPKIWSASEMPGEWCPTRSLVQHQHAGQDSGGTGMEELAQREWQRHVVL